ncbi:MAG: lipoate--protein ligase [Acutalibacteraceae bacterium]|nr:lipoate--protein ligase [Acutalibacteraceae bacterium]
MFILTLGESDPFFNLSAEEYFLCEKDEDFFLLWQNEPCIVIGRNQNAADEINGDYVRTRSLPVVRRMTGGGAVYHDTGNLNFSFIINGEADRVELCRPVIDVLRSIDVVAEISGRNDILVGGKKISGTAMCSRGGRSLFHGTLLISTDLEAMSEALKPDETKLIGHGVKSVRSRVANLSEYTKEVSPDIIGAMLTGYMTERGGEIYELGESDIEAIEKLRDSKYSTDEWNCGAERLQKSERSRLSCGTVYIKKKAACGRIEDIRIFGDFMNTGDVSEIEKRLKGIELRRGAITSALESVQTEKYIPGLTAGELADIIMKSE